MRQTAPPAVRFWKKIDRSNQSICWAWPGFIDSWGYGRTSVTGKHRTAHRVAYELAFGNIQDGMQVLHRCDNPPCVNPAHLFLGTNADNVADKVAKGRQARGDGHGLKVRGERHGLSRLTADAVMEIRRLSVAGVRRAEIATRFGIHPGYVSLVTSGRRWGWL